jgi:hypothetical protein
MQGKNVRSCYITERCFGMTAKLVKSRTNSDLLDMYYFLIDMNQRIVFTSKSSFPLLRPQLAGFFSLEPPFGRTFLLN